MINKSIFKAYDVRGVYPADLNEAAAYASGRAFVKLTGVKNVVIGYDARLSSPQLFKALAEGVLAGGAQVTTIDQVPTECVYFALAQYDFDGAVMVTASHNPKEYNGFKMIRREGKNLIWVRGKDLLGGVEEAAYRPSKKLEIREKDIVPDYLVFMQQFLDTDMKPLRVVVDTSNGVMGSVISQMKHVLPFEIIELNFKPDGNFPNHSPNPLEVGSADQIKELIVKNQADFGFMFDADADRLFLVDENGTLVDSDVARLLLAKYFLQKNPGAAIVYDLICSKAVPEFIKKWGGVPSKAQVGFVNIREALIQCGGVMGGEVSGHYCFRDYFYMDSGLIAFLTLLQVLSLEDKKVSVIVKELFPYYKTPNNINFKVQDQQTVLNKVKETYANGKQDFLDGVTVEYKDWWFNLRPSNTEPVIKLTLEADTRTLLEEKRKELENMIKNK